MDSERRRRWQHDEEDKDRREYTHTIPYRPWKEEGENDDEDDYPVQTLEEEEDEEEEERRCSNDVSVLLQYPWRRAEKRRKEGAAMMCQFCHSIHGEEVKKRRKEGSAMMYQKYPWRRADHPPKTCDKLLGLIVDNDNSADAAITIMSADDVIIIDDETKNKR